MENQTTTNQTKNHSGFGTAALVLGIIGAVLSFIPIINNLSFVLGVLAIIFGVVAFFKKSGKVKVIIAIILGILAIAMTLSAQQSLSDSIDKMTGDSTEEVLANDAEVTLGSFEVTEGEYGITNTKLFVTVLLLIDTLDHQDGQVDMCHLI